MSCVFERHLASCASAAGAVKEALRDRFLHPVETMKELRLSNTLFLPAGECSRLGEPRFRKASGEARSYSR